MALANIGAPLLPQKFLETVTCSECLNYLTVPPITVTRDGKITCGRHNGQEPVGTKSLFNTVIENFNFACVNHYDGCTKTLDIFSSKKHETLCVTIPSNCKFCSFIGNWCQIVNHVLKQHPLKLRKDGRFSFKIGTEYKETFMYPFNDEILFYSIYLTCNNMRIVISTGTHSKQFVQHFKIQFSTSPKFDINTFTDYGFLDSRSKTIVEKEIEEFIFLFGLGNIVYCQIAVETVKLSEKEIELEKKSKYLNKSMLKLIEEEKVLNKVRSKIREQKECFEGLSDICKQLSLTCLQCVSCEKNVTGAIYFCQKNHCYCQGCLSNTCIKCANLSKFKQIDAFNKITVLCDWPLCQKSVKISEYLQHKSSCQFRPYKCPDPHCLEILFSVQNLLEHWHFGNACSVLTKDALEFEKYGNYEVFWLIQNDLYHVSVKFMDIIIYVIIEDHTVLVNSVRFNVQGFYSNKWTDMPLGFYFNGKFVLNNNSTNVSGYRVSKIKICFT